MSSNRFNEAAGKGVDQGLAEAFAPVFNRLGRLTPSSHKSPNVPASIRGDSGKYQIGQHGRFERKGFSVEKDQETGKVKYVYGSDPKAIARHFGFKNLTVQPVTPERNSIATIDVPLFHVSFEIAALKSVLLTFDHILGDEAGRFTRSEELSDVREFVRSYVLDGKLDLRTYDRVILGLQYDKLHELRLMRERIAEPTTPFEHVMVVSANSATRSIDAVWWVAGIDPFGFRLCDDWRAEQFTFVLASGVLKNSRSVIEKVPSDFNCKLEIRRRAKQPRGTTKHQLEAIAGEISTYHRDAWQRAIDLNERNCAEFVRDCVIRTSQVGLQVHRDGSIATGLIRYLEMLFEWRLRGSAKRLIFDQVIKRHLASAGSRLLSEKVVSVTDPPAKLNWKKWHSIYTAVLDDLLIPLGLPGEVDQGQPIVTVEPKRPSQG